MSLKVALKVVCAEQGITQKLVAERAGMSEPYLSSIFSNGKMSVGNLQKVCDALGMKVWEFCKKGDY